METFLTPVVARLLSRFVKSAAGRDAPDLRANLQGGSLVLHNLELDLDAFLHALPVGVSRAFAGRLTVSIPWTSLASQPIQVGMPSSGCSMHLCPRSYTLPVACAMHACAIRCMR